MAELKIEMNKALRIAVDRIVREYMRNLGLREQWAALYADGSWTAGETGTRDEAEEIIAEAPETKAQLVRRWISDWQTEGEVTR